jgi:hypothetical protein
MAFEERNHDTRSASTRGSGTNRSGYIFGAAVVIFVVVAGLAYIGLSDAPVGDVPGGEVVEDARPVGAGTNPDGAADEFTEGLGNETSRGDFIEPGAPTEATPNPLLDGAADAPTATSIDDLDPGPAVDDEVLERMAPDGGTSGAEAGTDTGTVEPDES